MRSTLMGRQMAWSAGLVVGCWLLPAWPAAAAEAFIEMATAGIAIDAAQRKRLEGGEVDWVRRVKVNPAALQADQISVDLHDVTLYLQRDAGDPQAEPGQALVYSVDERGSPQRQVQTLSAALWAGTVQGSTGMAGSVGARGARVEIWRSARGFHAEFSIGKIHYDLKGDLLIKRDTRRFRVNENNDVRDVRPPRKPTPAATLPGLS